MNNYTEKEKAWFTPINGGGNLKGVMQTMDDFRLRQVQVPFLIRLIENPKYGFLSLFPGRVSLTAHDCIHILLGRGVLQKDEAFVIGYTMASTKKLTKFKKWLFLFINKHLYPKGYRFSDDEAQVFNKAVSLAEEIDGKDLSEVDFDLYMDTGIRDVRKELGIDHLKIMHYNYEEKERYPRSPESQRLAYLK